MNKLKKYRYFTVGAICILSFIISLGNSRQALAAQNVSDLSVTVVADKNRVKIGENITYTVTATNLGPDPAILVGVSHGLSDQLNFVSLSCDGISSDGTFCEYAILEPGKSVVSTFVATPNPNDQPRDRNLLIMTANIAFETTDAVDPDRGNNLASFTVRLTGRVTHP
jgi:uncharacterized repeat protein (TIGR01451 family)